MGKLATVEIGAAFLQLERRLRFRILGRHKEAVSHAPAGVEIQALNLLEQIGALPLS